MSNRGQMDALVYKVRKTKAGIVYPDVCAILAVQIRAYVKDGWALLIDSRDVYLDDVRQDDERGRR